MTNLNASNAFLYYYYRENINTKAKEYLLTIETVNSKSDNYYYVNYFAVINLIKN